MSDNKINTLGRIDQAIRGINSDGTDDGYIPPQSENGALERIEKSIKDIDIKGIKSGLPKVTNNDNGKVLQVKNGKWAKGEEKLKSVGNEDFKLNYITYEQTDTLYLVNGGISEHFERVSENLTESTPSVAIVGPVTIPPRAVVFQHEDWRAFHDGDEYGGWSTSYSEESSGGAPYLEYKFETPAMIEYIDCKFKYENVSDGDAQAIPIKIFIETSEDGTNWTRHERPLVDHDVSPSYKPTISTSRYAGTYKAVRFVSINPMCIENVALVSIGNIVFRGLVTNDDFNARSVWYKGVCYGDIDTPVELITGDIDYNNNVTLSHSGQEIFAMMNDGKLPIIFLEHDSLYGKTYEVYNYTAWYIDSNQEKIFEFTRIRRYEGRTVFWTVPINTVSASNVFKAKSESISSGPTRTTLFEAPDGGGVWMDSQTKKFDLNDDIDKYDEIQIFALTTEGDNDYHYTGAQTFIVEDMLVPAKSDANKGMCIEVMVDRSTGIDTSVLRVILVSQDPTETPKRTLWCAGARGIYGAAIHKVIGIKY